MATYWASLWSYINPAGDPSNAHFDTLVNKEDEILAENQKIVDELVALQEKLGANLDVIIEKNPRLAKWMEEIRLAPLDQKKMDLEEKRKMMAVLAEAVTFLQSGEQFIVCRDRLKALQGQNVQMEIDIKYLEKDLDELDRLMEKFEKDIKKREANLQTLMIQRAELQKK